MEYFTDYISIKMRTPEIIGFERRSDVNELAILYCSNKIRVSVTTRTTKAKDYRKNPSAYRRLPSISEENQCSWLTWLKNIHREKNLIVSVIQEYKCAPPPPSELPVNHIKHHPNSNRVDRMGYCGSLLSPGATRAYIRLVPIRKHSNLATKSWRHYVSDSSWRSEYMAAHLSYFYSYFSWGIKAPMFKDKEVVPQKIIPSLVMHF